MACNVGAEERRLTPNLIYKVIQCRQGSIQLVLASYISREHPRPLQRTFPLIASNPATMSEEPSHSKVPTSGAKAKPTVEDASLADALREIERFKALAQSTVDHFAAVTAAKEEQARLERALKQPGLRSVEEIEKIGAALQKNGEDIRKLDAESLALIDRAQRPFTVGSGATSSYNRDAEGSGDESDKSEKHSNQTTQGSSATAFPHGLTGSDV
jgi:hypothetical protein